MKSAFIRRAGLLLAFAVCAARTSAQDLLLRNGTVLTITKGTLKGGDVLVRGGRIAAVGRGLKAGSDVQVIDCTGKYITPGLIDAHSHLAIEGGINEATDPVTAMVDIQTVINHKDPGIKWALAGGVTTINTMHGSANPIGGLTATLKLRWGRSAEELKFEGARRHIKFALGENPKRVHAERGVLSRLGVAETIRRAFLQAREYQRDWDEYNARVKAGLEAKAPRKDLRMESLAGVLRGDIWVQCHCYRADEIEMLLKLQDEFGFRIGALQHVLEGYKVAPEIAKRGIGASTFADFWGYKVEAYDGIAHNAAALTRWGVRASVNSDSGERIRRMHIEAAKSMRAGGLSETECLSLVTINPAWQLGIDSRVGSLEAGKDADIAIWDEHPLSVYSRCITTIVDGEVTFRRTSDGGAEFGVKGRNAFASTAPYATPKEEGLSVAASAAAPLSPLPSVPAQKTDAPPGGSLAIRNARIVTVDGPILEHGTLVVRNGRIEAMGDDIRIPGGIPIIEGAGLSVYPGFINAVGTLGLTEIETVDVTQDFGERGPMKAHLRAKDAYNTHSAWVGVARFSGVTSTVVTPRGTGWAGQASLMRTFGRTVEDCTLVSSVAQMLSLSGTVPSAPAEAGMQQNSPQAAPTAVPGTMKELIAQSLKDARDYAAKWDLWKAANDPRQRPPRMDMTLYALMDAARAKQPVMMSANSKDDIEDALRYAADNGLKPIVVGGSDAERAAAALLKAGAPIVLTSVLSMPFSTDAYDKHFATASRLHKLGIPFCIATTETAMLPVHAGIAAAFGLPKEEALKAITLYPARILGLDSEIGSIGVGKVADLLITNGDPLDHRTEIKRVIVNGFEAPITSKHVEMYERFRPKGSAMQQQSVRSRR
jgi:imidazolonepropionase-like amidohydrolase